MKLLNKKVIVTGANRSIGQAIAMNFAREGADVFLSYRSDEEGARQTVNAIEKIGRQAKAFYADFLKLNEVENFYREAVAFLGSVDILVNNAAGYSTKGFFEVDIDEFEKLLKIGVTAPLLLTQLAAGHMIENGIEGNIINISAISGERPYLNRTAQSTVKAALNMLTKSSALELAQYKIRVNAVSPGVTPYEREGSEFLASKIPLKRVGSPEDQAAAVLFLASDESSWMTGQIMTIDGGQSLSF